MKLNNHHQLLLEWRAVGKRLRQRCCTRFRYLAGKRQLTAAGAAGRLTAVVRKHAAAVLLLKRASVIILCQPAAADIASVRSACWLIATCRPAPPRRLSPARTAARQIAALILRPAVACPTALANNARLLAAAIMIALPA